MTLYSESSIIALLECNSPTHRQRVTSAVTGKDEQCVLAYRSSTYATNRVEILLEQAAGVAIFDIHWGAKAHTVSIFAPVCLKSSPQVRSWLFADTDVSIKPLGTRCSFSTSTV